jgi:hypothetical protein
MRTKWGPAAMAGLVAYRKPYGGADNSAMNTRLLILRVEGEQDLKGDTM